MSDDYDPYGSGLDGYVHYTQAVNESQKGGGGGGGPSSNGGYLMSVISVMAFVFYGFRFDCALKHGEQKSVYDISI